MISLSTFLVSLWTADWSLLSAMDVSEGEVGCESEGRVFDGAILNNVPSPEPALVRRRVELYQFPGLIKDVSQASKAGKCGWKCL